MTRKEQREATRAKLVALAREEFRKRGFEAVTFRDISALAGVSTGAFFNYWSSKEEMFADVMGRPAPDFEATLRAVIAGHVSPAMARETLHDLKGEV